MSKIHHMTAEFSQDLGRLEGFITFKPKSPLVHCKSSSAPNVLSTEDKLIAEVDKKVTALVIKVGTQLAVGLVADGVPAKDVLPPKSIADKVVDELKKIN